MFLANNSCTDVQSNSSEQSSKFMQSILNSVRHKKIKDYMYLSNTVYSRANHTKAYCGVLVAK